MYNPPSDDEIEDNDKVEDDDNVEDDDKVEGMLLGLNEIEHELGWDADGILGEQDDHGGPDTRIDSAEEVEPAGRLGQGRGSENREEGELSGKAALPEEAAQGGGEFVPRRSARLRNAIKATERPSQPQKPSKSRRNKTKHAVLPRRSRRIPQHSVLGNTSPDFDAEWRPPFADEFRLVDDFPADRIRTIVASLDKQPTDVDKWEISMSPDAYLNQFPSTLATVTLSSHTPKQKQTKEDDPRAEFSNWLLLAQACHELWIDPQHKDDFISELKHYRTVQAAVTQYQASYGHAHLPVTVFVHCLNAGLGGYRGLRGCGFFLETLFSQSFLYH